MAHGINRVILIGNLGADVETRKLPSGASIAKFTVATSESWRDKAGGDRQQRTEWHKVVAFGRIGELAQEHLKRGQQVYIEGSLRTSKWQDKSGQDRYTTEIVAKDIQRLWGTVGPNNVAEKASSDAEAGLDDDIPW